MTDKLKPMEYHAEHKREVLGEGVHDGYRWAILSLGRYPCAYVEVLGHPWYKKQYYALPNARCHGGLTYSRDAVRGFPVSRKGWWIGWDYAHSGDYAVGVDEYDRKGLSSEGKKWTTEEIFAEVKEVIRQAKEVEENDND